MSENKSLIQRFASALGFKSERPDYGQGPNYGSDQYSPTWRFTGWGKNFQGRSWGTDINYAQEVGPLDDSSLVMAVCNDSGIQLAEARPAVRKPDSKGVMQPDLAHPVAQLIANPNPFHIWEDYCLAGMFSWWSNGNWYLQKVRNDVTGQVVELWYLPHFLVKPRWSNDGGNPPVPEPADPFLSHYQYDVPGREPVLIPRNDIIHLKRGTNLGRPQLGIGAFDSVISEIYGDKKASLFAATVLRNMGIVVPIISPKDPSITIDETQAMAIKEKWMQETTGDNVGAPVVSAVALEAGKFAWNPTELDLKELRMIPESRVAAVTRYPAAYLQFLVGLKNGTSYASYKEAREQAYESVIVPIQNGIGRRITQQLMPEFEKNPGAEFYFDTADVRVLQEDKDALMKRATIGYLGEVITRADARRMLNLETVPEDEVYRVGPGSGTQAEMPSTPKQFASLIEIDQYLESLEPQIKEFTPDAR